MAFELGMGAFQSVEFKFISAEGERVRADFLTLPNYNPAANNNFVSLWQAKSEDITWGDNPIKTIPVSSVSNVDRVTFDLKDMGLQGGTPYILGYSTGPMSESVSRNYCATSYIKSLEDFDETKQSIQKKTSLFIKEIDPRGKYFDVQYAMLRGYDPKANENWIGVWLAENDYMQNAPLVAVQIGTNRDNDKISIEHVLTYKHEYQVIYFAGGWNTDAAKLDKSRAIAMTSFNASEIS